MLSQFTELHPEFDGRPHIAAPSLARLFGMESQPLAIDERAIHALLSPSPFPAAGPQMAMPDRDAAPLNIAGTVAIVPLQGVITARPLRLFEAMGWTTSGETLRQSLAAAIANPDASAVVIDVLSPGGTVTGISEASQLLSAIRGASNKPIVAVSNYLCASAAYWLACAASHQIVAPLSGETGSIGVYSLHVDFSAFLDQEGVKYTWVSAGRYKTEGNPTEPLADTAAEFMQRVVDYWYEAFVSAVAKGRRTTATAVRSGYGEGRVLAGEMALGAGLVDRIETLPQAIERLQRPRARTAVLEGRAEDEVAPPSATAEEPPAVQHPEQSVEELVSAMLRER